MCRQNAVLIGGSGPPHQLKRPKIGGHKAEAGNPGGHLAARHEEIFPRIRRTPGIEADEDDEYEVGHDQKYVDP